MMKIIFLIFFLVWCRPALAGGIPTLDTVLVVAPRQNTANLEGVATSASEGTVTAEQLAQRPLLRPAEILEVVPGLIISQHSGDGKANQYYLRGFNLDHGTDFATTVMGMPVNLPTHAHGQGYTDLNFLIPELVASLQYRKGSYTADGGDFATAGLARIDYVRSLDQGFVEIGLGPGGYRRSLLADSPRLGEGHLLYGLEWMGNDGPWESPEAFGKFSGLLRYGIGSQTNGWSVAAMAYRTRWSATDQVPQRAVAGGLIGRYGNLDPSDGGRSERYSLSGEWSRQDGRGWLRGNAYAIDYRLNLWSNFTFCSTDPDPATCARGDQFEQADRRQVYGLNGAQTWNGSWGGRPTEFTLGFQSRLDRIGLVGLYASTGRQRWGTIREDQVNQGSLGVYAEGQVQWHETLRSVVGLRGDYHRFQVDSDTAANSGVVNDHLLSPKLAMIFGPWLHTEYYLNAGYGFHSNDARGMTARVNPDFRDTAGYGQTLAGSTPLVRARSYEAGLRSAPLPGWQTTLSLWRLDLASELVFVGDAGTTEPSFPSRRSGIEWTHYWVPVAGVIVDADLAYSRARYRQMDGVAPGKDRIPGALERALSLGIVYEDGGCWSGGLRLRYFGPRPLVEDNSVRSPSSILANLQLGYRAAPNLRFTLALLNLFNRRTSDIDYWYASQLWGEAASVEDRHSHPAAPRTLRLSIRLQF